MEIRKVSVSKIKPAKYNPRLYLRPGDPDYEKLKLSIETFGYVEPLVWNVKTGNLVGGHQRYKVLIGQGIKEVDVSVVNLSIEKEKALNLALNRIQGGWDNAKLAILLDELEQLPDFDVGLTGFDPPEISSLFDRYLPSGDEDNFDIEKEVEKITKPVTHKGDIIELGKHRILCGNSADLKNMKKLFQQKKADLVISDPPYNCAYKNERPIKRKGGKK